MTTGSPAKSAGSRIEPITTSVGQPRLSPRARTTDVFPVPGLPQSSTGTPACTDTDRASATAAASMLITSTPIVPDQSPLADRGTRDSRTGHHIGTGVGES